MNNHEAIPASLLVVGLSPIAAVIPCIRRGINWPMRCSWVPAIASSLAASRLARKLNGKHVRTAFAILVFAAIVAASTIISLAGG